MRRVNGRAMFRASPASVRLMTDGGHTLYRVPAGSMDVTVGPVLPIVQARAFLRDATAIADGRIDTDWGDIPQRPGQWVSVDLGAVREIAGVTHALGPYAHEFPRHLAIDVSLDGTAWEQVWEGRTVAYAFRAAVLAPRSSALYFTFAPHSGRFVRLRQLARHPYPWRVAEIQVHGPGGEELPASGFQASSWAPARLAPLPASLSKGVRLVISMF